MDFCTLGSGTEISRDLKKIGKPERLEVDYVIVDSSHPFSGLCHQCQVTPWPWLVDSKQYRASRVGLSTVHTNRNRAGHSNLCSPTRPHGSRFLVAE